MPLDLETLKEPTLQELFEKTRELRYVVLAIGAEPDAPPAWAIEACRFYHLQQSVSVEAPAAGRPPSYSFEDGVLLDRVADLVVSGRSLTAAVKQITGEGSDGTVFRRLMRTWRRHLRPELLVQEGAKRGKTNKWLDRAHQRETDRFCIEMWNAARAEIEAGNLSIEIDPKEEEERFKRAKWFVLYNGRDPEQNARIKIASLSRRAWMVEYKKAQLRAIQEKDDKTD